MSEQPFEYADYHRTVIAFHGTTSADRLVAGEPFRESDNDDDWFGKGIYFWEYAYKEAWSFKRYDSTSLTRELDV